MNFKAALMYLLEFSEYDIEDLVCAVIHDSDIDPEYSAVTCANRIKCYIKVMQELTDDFDYSDLEDYFRKNQFTPEEYQLFMDKYNKEATHYRSVKF